MKRYFNDYVIDVNIIVHPSYGKGFRAEYYIPKLNGLKQNIGAYETYEMGLTHSMIVERVRRIIESSNSALRNFTLTASESVACEALATIGRRVHELEDKEREFRGRQDHIADEYRRLAEGLRESHTKLFNQLND